MLRTQGEADGIKIAGGEEEYNNSLPQITRQLKALLARDLWGTTEYLQIMNADNEVFNKALELVQQRDIDALLMKQKR